MLDNPEVIAAINSSTVPVNPITPDVVLPDKPVFEQTRHYLETFPFGRSNFAWYFFADPSGQNILGTDQDVLGRISQDKPTFNAPHLFKVLKRAKRIVEIGDADSPELAAEKEKLLDAARQEVWSESMSVIRDTRIMTIWWLSKMGNRPLGSVVERLVNEPSTFAPGVKNLVILALADVVVADRPALPVHVPTLRRILNAETEAYSLPVEEQTWSEEEGDYLPLVYRRKAAETLETLLELELEDSDESVVDRMAKWWNAHRDDARFQERPAPGDYRMIAL